MEWVKISSPRQLKSQVRDSNILLINSCNVRNLRKERGKKMRVMYNLLTIMSVALVIWISSSWVGVMTHTAGKDYSNYNFFVMLGGE